MKARAAIVVVVLALAASACTGTGNTSAVNPTTTPIAQAPATSTTVQSTSTTVRSTTTTTTTTTTPPPARLPPGGPEAPSGPVAITMIEIETIKVPCAELLRNIVATDDAVFFHARRSGTTHMYETDGTISCGTRPSAGTAWSIRAFRDLVWFVYSEGVYVVEPSGSSRRAYTVDSVSDVAVVPGGVVVIGAEKVLIYDGPDTPDARVTFDVGGQYGVIDGDLVWTVNTEGVLLRIDPLNETIASFPLSGVAQTNLSKDRRWVQRFVATDNGIWINGTGNESYLIDKETGDVIDTVTVGTPGTDDGQHIIWGRRIALGFGAIFSTGEDGTVRYDLATGETTWHPWLNVDLSYDSIWSQDAAGLLRIDPYTLEITNTITTLPVPMTRFAYAHGAMWGTDQMSNVVTRITWQTDD